MRIGILEIIMLLNRKISSLAVVSAVCLAFFACKDEPDPKTMAKENLPSSTEVVEENASVNSILKAKVRKVLGETDWNHGKTDVWKRLRVGNKVVENDRIRTALESEAVLGVDDGSVLMISENSDVTLSAEILDSLNRKVSVRIDKGNVYFDVQKQKKGMLFQFNTREAVAAIRGTAGFVGSVNGKMVASLKEGRIEVIDQNGKSEMMVSNQTIVVDKKKGIVKMDLGSSGTPALSKVLDSLTKVMPEADVARELESVLKKFDSSYRERRDNFEKKLKFQASALPPEIYFPNVTLQARVNPGVIVTVLGEVDTVKQNGIYQRSFEWAEDAFGTKRFLASCSDGDVEVPCFMWTTEYVAPAAVEESENSPIDSAKAEPVAKEKPKAETSPESKPEAKAEEPVKDLKLSVNISGPRTEKVHNKTESYTARIKGSLSGITTSDLDQVKSIVLKRKGSVVETLQGASLSSLNFEFEQKIDRNVIANFEVAVTLKSGKVFSAKKTYEVYCNPRNHVGGEDAVSVDEEYENLKSKGTLKEE